MVELHHFKYEYVGDDCDVGDHTVDWQLPEKKKRWWWFK